MSTFVVTGAASGIGAATGNLLQQRGHRVIGVDLRDTDVCVDLATAEGRAAAVSEVTGRCPEGLAGLVPCAGIAGLTGVDPALLVSVNFFGAVSLVTGLRPLLERGAPASVVLLSSNSVTCQPHWDADVAAACLAGDEEEARTLATKQEAVNVYPSSKAALAWWTRREGVKAEWAGSGIRINAVAPGMVTTAMTDALRRDPQLGVFADAYPSALDRPGRPEEIAELIAFLLSPASTLMVGSVVFADGGTDAMLHPQQPGGAG